MTIHPMLDRVVVRPIRAKGGVIEVVGSKERGPMLGEVLVVGPGRFELGKRMEMTVKVGDHVLYPIRAGTEVSDGSGQCLIINESTILAVVEMPAAQVTNG